MKKYKPDERVPQVLPDCFGKPKKFKDVDRFWKCHHNDYKSLRSDCPYCDGLDVALGF